MLQMQKFTWKEFCETTSIHGISEVYNAHSRCSRVAWCTVFVCMCFISIYFICEVIISYQEAQLVVGVTAVNNATMTIPEMSVCYNGAFNASKLLANGLSVEAVRNLYILFQADKGSGFFPWAMFVHLNVNATTFIAHKPEIEDFMRTHGLQTYDELYLFAAIDCDFMFHSIRISPKDAVNYCRTDMVRKMIHSIFGVCYVLPAVEQVWPATIGGWQIILRAPLTSPAVADMQYSYSFGIEFGLPYEFQNMAYYSVPVNKTVNVMLQMTRYQKVPRRMWPRSQTLQCNSSTAHTGSGSYCNHLCYAVAMNKACGCVSPGLHVLAPNISMCMPDFNWACYLEMQGWRECQDNCIPMCEENAYDAAITFHDLNAPEFMRQLDMANTAEGMTVLNVAYPKLRYTYIEEQDTVGLDTAVGNIGGMVGLWLGGSIFTIVHAVTFLGACLLAKTRAASQRRLQRKPVNVTCCTGGCEQATKQRPVIHSGRTPCQSELY